MVLKEGLGPEAPLRGEAAEGEAQNSFSVFVAQNAEGFAEYANSMRFYRTSVVELREDFRRFSSIAYQQLQLNRGGGRMIGEIMRDAEQRMFNGAGTGGFLFKSQVSGSEVSIGRLSGVNIPMVANVRSDIQLLVDNFAGIVNPAIEEINGITGGILNSLETHLSSGYQAVADTSDYLNSLKDGKEKELIAPFFRDFVIEDDKERKQGRPGYLGSLRERWQGKSGELDESVFRRYWESMEQGKSPDVYEWAIFFAKVAMSSRDESGITEPNGEDVRRSMARVPFGQWPKMLREGYSNFARQDAANLFRNIHDRMAEFFPQVNQKTQVISHEIDTDADSSKRKRVDGSVIFPSVVIVEEPVVFESEKRTYGLGTVKSVIEGRQSAQIITVGADDFDSAVMELASSGRTPQMKEDFADLIRALVDDPERPGSKKMIGKILNLDRVSIPWRRFDPRALRGLRLRDPETTKYRVVYLVHEGIVAIKEIMHHNEFDKLKNKDL